jgi:hypothetical protein
MFEWLFIMLISGETAPEPPKIVNSEPKILMSEPSKKILLGIINENSGLLENDYRICSTKGANTLLFTNTTKLSTISCLNSGTKINNQPLFSSDGKKFLEFIRTSNVIGSLEVSKKHARFVYKVY